MTARIRLPRTGRINLAANWLLIWDGVPAIGLLHLRLGL